MVFQHLEGTVMADQPPTSIQEQVRAQFDRQVAHYLQGSAMADRGLLELIVRLAGPTAEQRVWEVACGAGFLACEFAKHARWVNGVDLSRQMLREAQTLAQSMGRDNTVFCQADAEALPFGHETCDLVTCKLAFHYFPHPQIAIAEMVRVATPTARVVLIDRVSPEAPEKRAYQNRLEKLRTPSKTYVYSESQLVGALEDCGLVVEQRARYPEQMEVDAWIRAAGPGPAMAHMILALLTAEGDPAGFQVRCEGVRWLMTHETCIVVASRR
jgi:ubiquinone/menaquinone biosynthesis C-methylase UbiE